MCRVGRRYRRSGLYSRRQLLIADYFTRRERSQALGLFKRHGRRTLGTMFRHLIAAGLPTCSIVRTRLFRRRFGAGSAGRPVFKFDGPRNRPRLPDPQGLGEIKNAQSGPDGYPRTMAKPAFLAD